MNRTSEMQDTNVVIANFMLNHLKDRGNFTIKTIADDCHVSPSSVTRFAKDLGYNGFLDFKSALIDLDLEKEEMIIDLEVHKITQIQNYPQFKNDFIERIIHGLNGMKETETLDINHLKEVAQSIYESDRIVFFGTQIPGNLILNAQHQLLTAGKYAKFYPFHKDQLEISKELGKRDMVFYVSLSGSYVSQKDIVINVLKSEATKILITQSNHIKLSTDFDMIVQLGLSDNEIIGKYKFMLYLESLIQVYYALYVV